MTRNEVGNVSRDQIPRVLEAIGIKDFEFYFKCYRSQGRLENERMIWSNIHSKSQMLFGE